jgi:hypothetical protein
MSRVASKAPSQKRSRPRAPFGCLDDAHLCCRNIAALAALLEVCGENIKGPHVAPELLSQTGYMISGDVRRLRELLRTLENALAQSGRRKM